MSHGLKERRKRPPAGENFLPSLIRRRLAHGISEDFVCTAEELVSHELAEDKPVEEAAFYWPQTSDWPDRLRALRNAAIKVVGFQVSFGGTATGPQITTLAPPIATALSEINQKLADITQKLEAILSERRSVIVPVETLGPEPFDLLRPVHVVVQESDGEFTATLFDANIAMSGDTEVDAVSNLKELIVDTFEGLAAEEDRLGPEPQRQLAVLRTLLCKKA